MMASSVSLSDALFGPTLPGGLRPETRLFTKF